MPEYYAKGKNKMISTPKRPILDIMRELREMFSHYELTRGELARTSELIDKLENGRITISVIGQFKRGKSRLMNCMLGEDILPVGIVPVTAVVTAIEYGERAARVRFLNGVSREVGFDELSAYINEQENSDNHLKVDRVELRSLSPFLKNGLSFVDTPGVGSIHQKNTDAAYSYVRESDAVIFLLSVDSPINQIEIDFLRDAREYAGKFYFAVNKIDTIDENERAEYLEYCRGQVKRLMGADDIRLFPVSARTGEGVEALKAAVERDCAEDGMVQSIIEASARKKMRDIGASAVSQIALYRNTLVMGPRKFRRASGELSSFCEGLKSDAEAFGSLHRSKPKELEARLNEYKNALSEKVRSLFGISYYYELSAVDLYRGGETGEDGSRDLSGEFEKAVSELCDSLNEAVSAIFMYDESDTYTITKRIYEVNALTRRLSALRDEL